MADLVKFLVKLTQLGSLGHNVLVDHEWWLDLLVSAFSKEVESITDQRLVEVDTIVCEEVASVPCDLCAYAAMLCKRWNGPIEKPHLVPNPWHLAVTTPRGGALCWSFSLLGHWVHRGAMFSALHCRPDAKCCKPYPELGRTRTSVKLTGTSLATRFPTMLAFCRIAISYSRVSLRFASTCASRVFFWATRSSADSFACRNQCR